MRVVRRKLKRIIDGSYLLSTLQKRLAYHVAPVRRSNPLIVYQMGKVGSEALEASLFACQKNRPVYRVHAMVEHNIEHGLRMAGTSRRAYFHRSKTDFVGLHLGREVRRDLHRHQWQVVSMVRDPMAQSISSFFQVLDLMVPEYADRLARDQIDVAELVEIFLRNYPPDNIFFHWFERELGAVFDVDIYDYAFPHGAGYVRITEPQVDLLIIRLEDFDRVAGKALTEFLGIESFVLKRKNEAHSKPYYSLYRRFIEQAEFPGSFIDAVYETAQARHFYSEAERTRFRARLNRV